MFLVCNCWKRNKRCISTFFSVYFHRKNYLGLGPFSNCYIDSFELLLLYYYYYYYYYFANMFDFGAIDPIEISVANFNFRIWSNQGNHVSIYIYIYITDFSSTFSSHTHLCNQYYHRHD